MSMQTNPKKENQNMKALFSVVCLCIIALGLIVYFSSTHRTAPRASRETTTVVTKAVQRAVTIQETTQPPTSAPTTKAPTKPKTTQPVSMAQGESNTPYKSFYKYPLSEAVMKGYSEELVQDKTMGDWRAHAAVDFTGAAGDEVVAINDGLVLAVYTDNLYGVVVEIDHGGKLVAKYCGLESARVKKGSHVDIGNTIGTLGTVPCEGAEEAHLHLETKLDGAPVNPLDVMGKTE